MEKNIEELTLLLMYLTSWEEDGYVADENGMPKEAKIKTCWKGYSFDVFNKSFLSTFKLESTSSLEKVNLPACESNI